MKQSYSQDCDYLREKFQLPPETTLYTLIHKVTEHLQSQDEEKELVKLKEEICCYFIHFGECCFFGDHIFNQTFENIETISVSYTTWMTS